MLEKAERAGVAAQQTMALLLAIVVTSTVTAWIYTEPTRTELDTTSVSLRTGSVIASDYDRFSRGNFSGASLSRLNLSVSLNENESTVQGTLMIDFYNEDPVTFNSIPFHLYPSGMAYATRPGKIGIHNVTTTGHPADALTFDVSYNQQLMWVNLPSPLLPGERTSLNISFTTTLPDGGLDRAGAYGSDMNQTRIFTFASCYPVPCVYDEFDGWNTDPYISVGDPFYYDMAFYNLSIDVPEGMVIASTGSPVVKSSQDGRTEYHYCISLPVREVTFSASRYYVIQSNIHNGVNVTSFYLPASALLWENNSLQQAVQALDLFNSTFGVYPYSTLNVVEQHAAYGGMEYPCQVYVTRAVSERIAAGQRAPWYLELVTAHEVAHQWWSQLVGDDCVDWGFLDEGLASWSHSYYAEHYYSDWEYFQEPRLLDQVRTFYAQYRVGCTVNQSNLVRPDVASFVDYIQMPVILEKLRQTIGQDAFVSGLGRFLRERYFLIATLNDLQDALESSASGDLDWFFLPWFNNPFLPDYAIRNAVYEPTSSSLTFEVIDLNRNPNDYDYSQQIPIEVYDGVGHVIGEANVWVNGTTSVVFQTTDRPSEIRLDYSGYVIVQLPNLSMTYYSTDQIVTSYLYMALLGTGVASAVIAVSITVCLLRKRRQG